MKNNQNFFQRTIEKEAHFEGIGLFTGEKSSIILKPAKEDTGILFFRKDIDEKSYVRASLDFVKDTPRCTIIGDEKIDIFTVEHLLAAVHGFEIDNLIVEVYGKEIPVADGSAKIFVDLIEKAGIKIQKNLKKLYFVKKPIYWSYKDIHLIALPSKEFTISYLLHYPNSKILKSQYFNLNVTEDTFKKEIASARTFSLYEEIKPFLDKNLIKGGGLNNAVIIKDDIILNPDGLRFFEEMARHKILDLMGDLFLIGRKIFAHIIAIRSGHFSNIAFAKKIIEKEEL